MSVAESPRLRREASPLELFHDLVLVFAVSQLSHHLLEHLTWRGAAETAVLLVAVFGTWVYISFCGSSGSRPTAPGPNASSRVRPASRPPSPRSGCPRWPPWRFSA
ncbi:low temperature requirement protein A [Streptomyces sp. NBC_00566]|uniref:low temperature requirement protein A n=1 Tax=Streptomyces sp. NBC_00566 TaxID=2975778 RepID=UPI002E809A74|nr:low temperature requirement protein A [Streptomyces sp. NBC_00566]WUB90412.1 low temperature requirement protein A [Streptomyces sp. NBC_00566]